MSNYVASLLLLLNLKHSDIKYFRTINQDGVLSFYLTLVIKN